MRYTEGCKCKRCVKGNLKKKPKTVIKLREGQEYYYSTAYVCNCCKSVYTNESDKIYVGSKEDVAFRSNKISNQTSLF